LLPAEAAPARTRKVGKAKAHDFFMTHRSACTALSEVTQPLSLGSSVVFAAAAGGFTDSIVASAATGSALARSHGWTTQARSRKDSGQRRDRKSVETRHDDTSIQSKRNR
jgi:hypothetical protein